jgi:F0F1-type ATP synthase epsilon subunit
MKLKIVTTQRVIEHEIDWIELNTPAGNMTIQPGHAPMIIELRSGHELLYQKSDGSQDSIMIVQGIAHVLRYEVKILLPMDL